MDLLLEIGTEELPAGWVPVALETLSSLLARELMDARLVAAAPAVRTFGTPRRIAAIVANLSERQPDLEERVEGPPEQAAFSGGQPTRAAEGFAKKLGVSIADLKIEGGRLVGVRRATGRPAIEVLSPLLERVVKALPARQKSMRWADHDVSFPRPVRWIVALAGTEVVPFRFADAQSGRETRGHRFRAPAPIALTDPSHYESALLHGHVIADLAKRRAATLEAAQRAAATENLSLDDNLALLDEVTQLTEEPHALVGHFDAADLALPPEVVKSEMQKHQRYFPVKKDGKLANAFVVISNVPVADPALSRAGYERVLKARLSDARFFFEEDRKQPLEARVDRLDRIVFQQALGSMGDKVRRIETLSEWLAPRCGADAKAARAVAHLCKADLTAAMVGEFPELQGVMGRVYATSLPDDQRQAVEDHYAPRTAEGALPSAPLGAVVALADRFDSLAGIFGIGKEPSASADPFGLRRAALAVIRTVLHFGFSISLKEIIAQAAAPLGAQLAVKPDVLQEKLHDFFRGRLKALWADRASADVVDAVLEAGIDDLVAAQKRLTAVASLQQRADFLPIAETFTRVSNLLAQAQEKGFSWTRAVAPPSKSSEAEQRLWAAVAEFEKSDHRQVEVALLGLGKLQPHLARFFEDVMVMVDDTDARAQRLALLGRIQEHFRPIADFRRIQTKRA